MADAAGALYTDAGSRTAPDAQKLRCLVSDALSLLSGEEGLAKTPWMVSVTNRLPTTFVFPTNRPAYLSSGTDVVGTFDDDVPKTPAPL